MPTPSRRFPSPAFFLAALVAFAPLTGCVFVPSHQVSVDAISGPNPFTGQAYQLVDKDPMVAREARQKRLVFACISAALETKGLYEAPAGVKADLIIEVDYGTSRGTGVPGPRRSSAAPATTENFLSLSGRLPKPAGTPGKGEEIWNVRTSIIEDSVDLGTLIPVLAGVTADYIGQDTQVERTMNISERQPNIAHVKSVAQAVASGRAGP